MKALEWLFETVQGLVLILFLLFFVGYQVYVVYLGNSNEYALIPGLFFVLLRLALGITFKV